VSLESIVNVTITSDSRGLVRKSFGEVLVAGKHDAWGERYRVYDAGPALQNIVADGIVAGSPIYKTVQSVVSQNPKVEKVIVGRLVSDFTHISTLTVQASVTVGDVYAFNVRAPNGGAVTAISYTAQSGDTPTLVATAVAALINAITDISSAGVAAVITNTADNVNEMWQFEDLDVEQFAFEDTTVDSSLATELGEINTLYPGWYDMHLADCQSKARILVVAAWVETLEKIFGATSFDTENGVTGTTTSVMYALNAADYFRTYCIYSNDQNSRAAAGWAGKMLPLDPGSATWAYKSISGTTVDTMTASFEAEIKLSKGNTYTVIAGLNNTTEGTMASGEWIDAIWGRDWFVATVRENVFGLLANSLKVPYTNPGVESVKKEVRAAQDAGIAGLFLAAEPAPFVTAPRVADIANADKIARLLPDVYFEQTLAGAIHAINLVGVLKV
jgi:hypothetical protein